MSTLSERAQLHAHERRWWILTVLMFSLLVIVLDNTVLDVAIPTIVRDLHATNSQLQWMVDSYVLVFAGLLLTCGSLGDRFGRRGALQIGLVVFGLGSLASAFAQSSAQLIATRAFMGIGGALIMPATLSIITNVFTGPERSRAIGFWAGTGGLAAVLGPVTAGFLLQHFYWGSIFLVNVPVVIVGLVAGAFLIPTSKDPSAPRLDPVGAVLSIVSLVVLLYGIIEAPVKGWGDDTIVACFLVGGLLLIAFLWWEHHTDHPMLDIGLFKNPRFSAASFSIMAMFFTLFGTMFLVTQYLQFVKGYSPLEAGVRLLPVAITLMIVSPLIPRVVDRLGTKVVVSGGLALSTAGLLALSQVGAAEPYWPSFVWRLTLMALGFACTMAPATESIMGSLPLAKAGVGSAVNDTTRQVGGAMGVAVMGSVVASIYGSHVRDFLRGKNVPTGEVDAISQQIGAALKAARDAPGLALNAINGFIDGMQVALVVAAAVALTGAFVALVALPARAREHDHGVPATDGTRVAAAEDTTSAVRA